MLPSGVNTLCSIGAQVDAGIEAEDQLGVVISTRSVDATFDDEGLAVPIRVACTIGSRTLHDLLCSPDSFVVCSTQETVLEVAESRWLPGDVDTVSSVSAKVDTVLKTERQLCGRVSTTPVKVTFDDEGCCVHSICSTVSIGANTISIPSTY